MHCSMCYMYNWSGFPARFADNLNMRYYINLTALINAGYTTSSLTVYQRFAQDPVTLTLNQYSGNIYYVEVALNDGTEVYPGGQSQSQCEVQLAVTAPSSFTWVPTADYSYTGLTSPLSQHQLYLSVDGNTLLWGTPPSGGATSPPATATPVPTATPVVTATPTLTQTATPVPTATPTLIQPRRQP